MLDEARDILATFYLEKRLGQLRERYIAQVLAGAPPGPEYWQEGEAAVFQEMKVRFYALEQAEETPDEEEAAAEAAPETDSEEPPQDPIDAAAFEARTQRLTEQALWMTHRRLKQIPYHGHPDYRTS